MRGRRRVLLTHRNFIYEMKISSMNPFIRNSIQMAQLLILLSVLPPSYQVRSHLSPVMWLLHYVQLHCEPPSHLLHISSALACFQGTDLSAPVCVFSFFLFQNSLPFNLQMSVCAAPFLRSLSYCFKKWVRNLFLSCLVW